MSTKKQIAVACTIVVLVLYVSLEQYSKASRLVFAIGHRITPANIPQILSAIAWPAVVLGLVVLLRHALLGLLERLEYVLWGDKKINFKQWGAANFARTKENATGEAVAVNPVEKQDALQAAPPHPGPPPAIAMEKIGNIYWLGSDLVNAVDVLLRNGNRDAIAHILRQANHHMKVIGLVGSPLQSRLQRLRDDAAKSLEKDWTAERRVQTAQDIFSIMVEFGHMTERLQPGFDPNPKD